MQRNSTGYADVAKGGRDVLCTYKKNVETESKSSQSAWDGMQRATNLERRLWFLCYGDVSPRSYDV